MRFVAVVAIASAINPGWDGDHTVGNVAIIENTSPSKPT